MDQFHPHTFHVPVMGIGYTIDSPLKLAHLGITSVVSLVDDMLMEKMREFHSKKANLLFQGISSKMEDFRARRITAFLDMLDTGVRSRIENMKNSLSRKSDEIDHYFDLLPETSTARQTYFYLKENANFRDLRKWVNDNLYPGHIDVNIMTKLDKENFAGGKQLPVEFNDAHAALRGFAKSKLQSSLVLSAGMNTRLFSYLENWDDFYPDSEGNLKKKITIKVSDYRSAVVQGKLLAKKGIWVSEFRIESGLNCGGHAFASQGNLIGPVLEEFKNNRVKLIADQFEVFQTALNQKGRVYPSEAPTLRISAQGGVGTAAEHDFLLNYYQLDSVGWGTPFLLVPEAVSIDDDTIYRLSMARENDLYLSNISPLGVPFNNLRNNTKDAERDLKINQNKPGSGCVKQYCSLSKEFEGRPQCTASRSYQRKKILTLEASSNDRDSLKKAIADVTEKSCICTGLGTSALLANDISTEAEGPGVSVCPGPNMAYFSKKSSLKEMIGHIYGQNNLMERNDRPDLFVKELSLNLDYYIKETETSTVGNERAENQNKKIHVALEKGIEYYRQLFSLHHQQLKISLNDSLNQLDKLENRLNVGSFV